VAKIAFIAVAGGVVCVGSLTAQGDGSAAARLA
jgi:hypothetical protein